VPSKGVAMEKRIDTPEQLIRYATDGRLTKHALSTLLTSRSKEQFLAACETIEKRYTEECTATGDPCLESGCSTEGEICLQPVLRAGTEYHKACGAAWSKLFADPENRADLWHLDVGEALDKDT